MRISAQQLADAIRVFERLLQLVRAEDDFRTDKGQGWDWSSEFGSDTIAQASHQLRLFRHVQEQLALNELVSEQGEPVVYTYLEPKQ